MWSRLRLRTRLFIIITALVLISVAGSSGTVYSTYRNERLFAEILDRHLPAFQAAAALESALVNQKGFVTYYFLDGDVSWLRQLGEYRQIFNTRLADARRLTDVPLQTAIDRIETEYRQYIEAKDRVIAHYERGEREAGARLHRSVRERFFSILQQCEAYKQIHAQRVAAIRLESHREASRLRIMAGVTLAVSLCSTGLLLFTVTVQILRPLQRLAQATGKPASTDRSQDVVAALHRNVQDLIEDVDQTHSELAKSREHLLQSEKMAMVGKLAAGMAHSIRNPFTSIKMRLFSLNRTLTLGDGQKEDFDVISEEIRHVDTIVQNFLEFSRPPRLKMQPVSPSVVVDMALQLLEHRLKAYDVTVHVHRRRPLPEIDADPEQLKEVLVNLIVNACEAIQKDGRIDIHEGEAFAQPLGRVAVLRFVDNGPGIAPALREKVLQPFFTTKEEGTGLGLSIAARIVAEHRGRLDVQQGDDQGAAFVITLPIP